MRLLLDTHTIIWVLTDDSRLSEKVKALILDPDNIVYFSTASLWEIAIKHFKNPMLCPYKEELINDKCIASGFQELTIKNEHIFGIKKLKIRADHELSNFDPFDRLLLSQAKSEGCLFLTADSNIGNYDEAFICKIR